MRECEKRIFRRAKMPIDFKICTKCGALIRAIDNCSGGNCGIQCCGLPMQTLIPNTHDGAVEKHVPVVTHHKGYIEVAVGEVPHPSTSEHYIEWVLLKTNLGEYVHYFEPGEAPATTFLLQPKETVEAVLSFCNLHGLWQKNLD